MKVKIKKFDLDMDVKKKGIEFEVRSTDGKKQLGDCYLTNTRFIWCSGRKAKSNGIKIKWGDFITLMGSKEVLKRALKAAKNPPHN